MGEVKTNKKCIQPALWPFCRIIAHETRLILFKEIIKNNGLCVSDLATLAGTTNHNASTQLRALCIFGLILPSRRKQKVFYAAEHSGTGEFSERILPVLKQCFRYKMPIKTIIHQATAFSHQRRIEIIKTLSETPMISSELTQRTSIKSSALARHLNKLEERKFVTRNGNIYSLTRPKNPLGSTLLDAALSS